MGYCRYYTNPNGNAVATWIGTSGEKVPQKQVIFTKGSLGATNQNAACDEARKQFCNLNGGCNTSRPYKPSTPPKKACVGRCGPGERNTTPNSSCATCVKISGSTTGSTGASSGGSPFLNPSPPSGGGSGSGGQQNSYCKTNCDALPFFGNLGCRLRKMGAGCGGGIGGPPLEGNPFGQSGTALDPAQKNAVCAKNCSQLDVFCKGAKLQAGCGGTDYTFWIIAGVAGIAGIVILTRLLK